MIGVFPPSYHYIGWTAGSLDRYLLAPRAAGDRPRAVGAARGAHQSPARHDRRGGAGLFSVAGTRDYLVFMREVWAMGDEAVAAGVPLESPRRRLRPGTATTSTSTAATTTSARAPRRADPGGSTSTLPPPIRPMSSPPNRCRATSSSEKRPYSSWLLREPHDIFLLRRWGTSWPPWPSSQAGPETIRTGREVSRHRSSSHRDAGTDR